MNEIYTRLPEVQPDYTGYTPPRPLQDAEFLAPADPPLVYLRPIRKCIWTWLPWPEDLPEPIDPPPHPIPLKWGESVLVRVICYAGPQWQVREYRLREPVTTNDGRYDCDASGWHGDSIFGNAV